MARWHERPGVTEVYFLPLLEVLVELFSFSFSLPFSDAFLPFLSSSFFLFALELDEPAAVAAGARDCFSFSSILRRYSPRLLSSSGVRDLMNQSKRNCGACNTSRRIASQLPKPWKRRGKERDRGREEEG